MADRQHGAVEAAAKAAAAAMRALPVKSRNRLLFDLLAEAGATGIVIPGANGEIEGSIADRTVILKYLKNIGRGRSRAVRLMQAVVRRAGAGKLDRSRRQYRHDGRFRRRWPASLLPCRGAGAGEPGACSGAISNGTALPAALRCMKRRRGTRRQSSNSRLRRPTSAITGCAPAAPDSDSAYGEAARDDRYAVPARPVDTLIDAGSLAGPVLVKTDVQGAEGHALAGGAALFGRADIALLEYWPYGLRRLGTDPAALFAAAGRHFGYAALLADDQAPETVRLAPLDELAGDLIAAEEENRIVALDLVLSKERDAALARLIRQRPPACRPRKASEQEKESFMRRMLQPVITLSVLALMSVAPSGGAGYARPGRCRRGGPEPDRPGSNPRARAVGPSPSPPAAPAALAAPALGHSLPGNFPTLVSS